MEKRGRPVASIIRDNIAEILFHMGKAYGYDIYKVYAAVYPKATMRSIYYHLKKGVDIGEFEVEEITTEHGNFSWGDSAQKIYYKLKNARPKGNEKVRDYLDKTRAA